METITKTYSELLALIALIDEPDEPVFNKIRNGIMDYGYVAIPILEKYLLFADDKFTYNRMIELIDDISFKKVAEKLKKWAKTEEQDIIKVWILLSEFLHHDFNENQLSGSFMRVFKDIWLEINNRLTALEKVNVINHIIYKIYSFSGPVENRSPDSYLADNFMRYKKGAPLTMSMFYLSLAQRLELPVFGVGLPHHFILAYVDEQQQIKAADHYSSDDVLFYINPFNKGVVFTKNEVDLYLKQYNIEPKASYSNPCSNLAVMRRYINELEHACHQEGELHKATLIKGFQKVLTI